MPSGLIPTFIMYCFVTAITPGPANLCSLASAMASSTIPNISKQIGNRKAVRRSVGDVIRFTMVISIPCAVGLGVFGKEIIAVLWPGTPAMGAEMMLFGSTAVIFYSLSSSGKHWESF